MIPDWGDGDAVAHGHPVGATGFTPMTKPPVRSNGNAEYGLCTT